MVAQMILPLYASGTNFSRRIDLYIGNLLAEDSSIFHFVLLCTLANQKGNLLNFQKGHYELGELITWCCCLFMI